MSIKSIPDWKGTLYRVSGKLDNADVQHLSIGGQLSGRFGADESHETPEKLIVDTDWDLPEQSKHFRLESTYEEKETKLNSLNSQVGNSAGKS